MNRVALFLLVACAFLAGCGLFDSPKPADTKPKVNTFPDYQHIEGRVKGAWTKANNPHKLTGMPVIAAGDTLTIQEGVELEGPHNLTVDSGGTLVVLGSDSLPVILAHNAAFYPGVDFGGGNLTIMGNAKLSRFICPRGIVFSQLGSLPSLEIDHGTFLHGRNDFLFQRPATQVTRISIRHSIFAMPIGNGMRGPYSLTTKYGVADTTLWTVDSNCFYNAGYTDFFPAFDLTTLQGEFTAAAWPGNGNLAADPMFVDYVPFWQDRARYLRSDSVLITTVYDLHLKPASPCKGMGAYEK